MAATVTDGPRDDGGPARATPATPATSSSVEVDASPFLERGLVHSGYSGQDRDDNDSSCDEEDGTTSGEDDDDDVDEEGSATRDAVQQVLGQCVGPLAATPGVSFRGDISVSKSSRVQFGNNTHIHGPVTVVVSDKKALDAVPAVSAGVAVAAVPAPGSPPALAQGAFAAAGPKEDGVRHPPDAPSPPSASLASGKDKQILLAALEAGKKSRLGVLVGAAVAVSFIAVLGVVGVLALVGGRDPAVRPTPLPNGLTIVDRKSWLAQPARSGINDLMHPVEHVIIHHSATDPCFSHPECVKTTRYLQMFHMESNNWSDIAYNFLVGGNGYVYEGRGWDKEGAHTLSWNKRSVGVCLIGTFMYERPTNEQMRTVLKLAQYGVELDKIREDYKLMGVCQLRSTESPGRLVQEEIRRWDHWWNFTDGDSNCK